MPKEKLPRCGVCNVDNIKDWDAHKNTPLHKRNELMFKSVVKGGLRTKEEIMPFMKQEPKKESEDGIFDSISGVYAIIECYEMGAVNQREYLKACASALEYFEKKYGKDDFRHRELFAHMNGDSWENIFEVRCLLHCEVIGCPHETITECDKYKSEIAIKILKDRKCQHCDYLEGVKEKWENV